LTGFCSCTKLFHDAYFAEVLQKERTYLTSALKWLL